MLKLILLIYHYFTNQKKQKKRQTFLEEMSCVFKRIFNLINQTDFTLNMKDFKIIVVKMFIFIILSYCVLYYAKFNPNTLQDFDAIRAQNENEKNKFKKMLISWKNQISSIALFALFFYLIIIIIFNFKIIIFYLGIIIALIISLLIHLFEISINKTEFNCLLIINLILLIFNIFIFKFTKFIISCFLTGILTTIEIILGVFLTLVILILGICLIAISRNSFFN